MILIPTSVILITCTTIVNRYFSKIHPYNVNYFILLVETLKCITCAIVLKYKKKNIIPKTIEWGYWIVAFLYFIANALILYILQNVSAGTFIILSQHRLLWVVMLSWVLLGKSYSIVQIISCVINFIGVLLAQSNLDSTTNNDIIMIVVHGGVSALAAVVIEKSMKNNQEDYFQQGLKLYSSGLPIYIFGALVNGNEKSLPPLEALIPMLTITVSQGIVIGAIYKYHGATIKTFIQSSAIVLTIFVSYTIIDTEEKLSNTFWTAVFMVITSTLLFKMNILTDRKQVQKDDETNSTDTDSTDYNSSSDIEDNGK